MLNHRLYRISVVSLLLLIAGCGSSNQGLEATNSSAESTMGFGPAVGELEPATIGVPHVSDSPVVGSVDVQPCEDVAAAVDVPLQSVSSPPSGEIVCALGPVDAERPEELPPLPRTGMVLYVPEGHDPTRESLHEIVASGGIAIETDILLDDPPPFPTKREANRASGGRAPATIKGHRGRVYRVLPQYVHASFYPVLADGTRLRIMVTAGATPDRVLEYAESLSDWKP